MSFRFQSILDLRLRQRDEAGLEVGKVLEAIAKVESQIDDIHREVSSLQQSQFDFRMGAVSVEKLLVGGRYLLQLEQDRKTLQETLAKLGQEYERRRNRLADAQAELKKFEILQDRQIEKEREVQGRRDQEISDEAAARIVSARIVGGKGVQS
jgi:flagellar protein FliJ